MSPPFLPLVAARAGCGTPASTGEKGRVISMVPGMNAMRSHGTGVSCIGFARGSSLSAGGKDRAGKGPRRRKYRAFDGECGIVFCDMASICARLAPLYRCSSLRRGKLLSRFGQFQLEMRLPIKNNPSADTMFAARPRPSWPGPDFSARAENATRPYQEANNGCHNAGAGKAAMSPRRGVSICCW